jgi:hypothetical protein
MANVLFYITYADDSPIQAATMELMRAHQAIGDTLWVVKCAQELRACHGAKRGKDAAMCLRCESRMHYTLRALSIPVERAANVTSEPQAEGVQFPDFTTVEELKAYEVDHVNVGLGVASTVISALRDHDFDTRTHRGLIEINLQSALRVLFYFRRRFAYQRPDLVYTFNGRFAESRPLIELCMQHGIPFRTYELGSFYDRYRTFENTLPHDFVTCSSQIESDWLRGGDEATKIEIATRWYANRRDGVAQGYDPVYIELQRRHAVPDGFDARKHNIAVFLSSEDEFAAIGEIAATDLFRDQNDALRQILQRLDSRSDVHLYVRAHPNLRGLENAQTRGLSALRSPQLTVISAESPIDSYALMSRCDRVLCFGSTMGAEATVCGKPSILYGRAFYEGLDAVYEPRSLDDLLDLLTATELKPKPQLGALKFAYWYIATATEMPHYRELIYGNDVDAGYDRLGRAYKRVMRGLLRISYPVTYTPFYRSLLRGLALQSRRRHLAGRS